MYVDIMPHQSSVIPSPSLVSTRQTRVCEAILLTEVSGTVFLFSNYCYFLGFPPGLWRAGLCSNTFCCLPVPVIKHIQGQPLGSPWYSLTPQPPSLPALGCCLDQKLLCTCINAAPHPAPQQREGTLWGHWATVWAPFSCISSGRLLWAGTPNLRSSCPLCQWGQPLN